MMFFLVVYGGIALFGATILVLDYLGRRQERMKRESSEAAASRAYLQKPAR